MSVPVVSNYEPPNGQPVKPTTPIQFDITDTVAFVLIIPMIILDPYTVPEPVHNNTDFEALYITSSRVVITDGYRYTIRRKGGWPTQPTLIIWAVNVNGEILFTG